MHHTRRVRSTYAQSNAADKTTTTDCSAIARLRRHYQCDYSGGGGPGRMLAYYADDVLLLLLLLRSASRSVRENSWFPWLRRIEYASLKVEPAALARRYVKPRNNRIVDIDSLSWRSNYSDCRHVSTSEFYQMMAPVSTAFTRNAKRPSRRLDVYCRAGQASRCTVSRSFESVPAYSTNFTQNLAIWTDRSPPIIAAHGVSSATGLRGAQFFFP